MGRAGTAHVFKLQTWTKDCRDPAAERRRPAGRRRAALGGDGSGTGFPGRGAKRPRPARPVPRDHSGSRRGRHRGRPRARRQARSTSAADILRRGRRPAQRHAHPHGPAAYPLVKDQAWPVRLGIPQAPLTLYELQSLATSAPYPDRTPQVPRGLPAPTTAWAARRLASRSLEHDGVAITETYAFSAAPPASRFPPKYRNDSSATSRRGRSPGSSLTIRRTERFGVATSTSYLPRPAIYDGAKYRQARSVRRDDNHLAPRGARRAGSPALQHHFVSAIMPPKGAIALLPRRGRPALPLGASARRSRWRQGERAVAPGPVRRFEAAENRSRRSSPDQARPLTSGVEGARGRCSGFSTRCTRSSAMGRHDHHGHLPTGAPFYRYGRRAADRWRR